jgi:hypothetical protein
MDISRTRIVLATTASDSNPTHQNMLKYTFRGFFYEKPWCYAGTAGGLMLFPKPTEGILNEHPSVSKSSK